MTKVKNITIQSIGIQGQHYVAEQKQANGMEYFVVPVVMMVEGVHNGSRGAIFHSAKELERSVSKWNGVPVTLSHPQVNGQFVSADSEEIEKNWGIGFVANAYMQEKSLRAEAWINVQKATALCPDLLDNIKNGKIIEVSIGLFSDEDNVSGIWNNEQYTSSAFNYVPDHLALLPDEIGACSIMDGCGVRVNVLTKKKGGNEVETLEVFRKLKNDLAVFPVVFAEGLLETVSKVRETLYSKDSPTQEFYLEEVYADSVVYRKATYTYNEQEGTRFFQGEQLYKQTYVVDDGVVTFTGEPVKVTKKVDYINLNKKEVIMCAKCKEKAKALVANANTHFDETDLEWLEALTEDKLDKLIPKVKTVEKVVEVNKEVTKDEALQVLGIDKEHFDKGVEIYNARRTEVVNSIITNTEEGVWTKEILDGMQLEVLEKLEKSVVKPKEQHGVYFSAGTSSSTEAQISHMPLPGIEFETKN